MKDRKYVISGLYLSRVREEVKNAMKMVKDEPLVFDVKKAKMLNRMSEVVEMLSPDIAEKELMPYKEHVCMCKEGKSDGCDHVQG